MRDFDLLQAPCRRSEVNEQTRVSAVLFIREEQHHVALLQAFMQHHQTALKRSDRLVRRVAGLELYLYVLVSAGLIGIIYYRALELATDCRRLKALCSVLVSDELEDTCAHLGPLMQNGQPPAPPELLTISLQEFSMLSYVYFGTNDLARATRFYDAVLAPLGMPRCVTGDAEWDRVAAGWGVYEEDGVHELAFWVGTPFDQRQATTGNGSMVAFSARSWKAVEDFHAAALLHGGICDGAPGLRLHYGPDFYAAYVRDPDGNKLAVVCRDPSQRHG